MTAWIYAESQLWSRIAAWFAGIKSEFVLNFITKNRWRMLLNGLGTTLLITLFSCLMGIAIGVVVSIVRSTWDKAGADMRPGFSRGLLRVLNRIAVIYLTVIRGTPVVIQLMIAYYVIFAFSSNGVLVATLAFGLNSGAYVAEIFRGGIMSIDTGQFEAGRSLGFNYVQTMAYIVVPQAIKNVLPALANEFISLLKETSVAGYVAVSGSDLRRQPHPRRHLLRRCHAPHRRGADLSGAGRCSLPSWFRSLERRLRNSDH